MKGIQTIAPSSATAHMPMGPTIADERSRDARRQQRDAEEDEQRAEAHPDEHLRRAEIAAEEPPQQRGEPERGQQRPSRPSGSVRSATRGSVAPSRTAAIGGTRVARTAGRRLASSVTMIPTSERDDDRARLEDQPAVRQREADGVEQLEEPLARARARGRARRSTRAIPIDERLDDDRAQHLPARRADRAQRRELARALGDRDRERVRDHEAADEERDAAEREQEAAQERDERVRVRSRPRPPAPSPSAPARSAAGSR